MPKQAAKTVASADGLSLFLGERTPSWCLLHELAHDMTSTDEDSNGHSSGFMGAYLKLLARYLRMDLLELAKSAADDGLLVDLEAGPSLRSHAHLHDQGHQA